MTKCEHCGFDSETEFIRMIGAPCGYKECITFTCCVEGWKIHMNKYHRKQMMDEIVGFVESEDNISGVIIK